MSRPHGQEALHGKRQEVSSRAEREQIMFKMEQQRQQILVQIMNSLNSIAESLHVANEEKILDFRDRREKAMAEEEAQRAAAAVKDPPQPAPEEPGITIE